jgi:hypothetical protein
MAGPESDAPLDRGIHPLRLLFLIALATLSVPVLLYLFLLLAFSLMPGGFD